MSVVDSGIAADGVTRRVGRAHARLLALLDGLDDTGTARPSALPGWSRGHVVQHLTDNALAFERQARYAPRARRRG
ncbi:maleylpyruvate isomerase N-terminal domain-containing protein [Streptomyces boncukensis]|uniref:maleylpyruvate isomerase N-terminal domain-containing protein n=1 Tax=Streptomyces boncukensis TaxID=2711219 RepID=UPI0030BA1308